MKYQRDIIDDLVIRPVKVKTKKTKIKMNKIFESHSTKNVNLPKSLSDTLEQITNPKSRRIKLKS